MIQLVSKKAKGLFTPFIVLLTLLFSPGWVAAANLVVQESGPAGTFNSIAAAVTAASDGDVLLIVNRPGGLPWDENITITKSLQLQSATDGVLFLVRGNYTISPAATGKTVSIIGMENAAGDIKSTGHAPGASRCTVNIMGSKISGNIFFNNNNFNISSVGNEISNGRIHSNFGKVIGNKITNTTDLGALIYIGSELASEDTIQIIGNKLTSSSGSSSAAIEYTSTTQYYYISNNAVNFGGTGIWVINAKTGGSGRNTIINNSIVISSGSNFTNRAGLNVYIPSNSLNQILNNAIRTNSSTAAIGIHLATTGNVIVSYNAVSNNFTLKLSNVTDDGTNYLNLSYFINTDGLPDAILNDKGSPATAYNDLNLTRNDLGAYGGSYSLTNFFPASVAVGAPRVYMVKMPRAVYHGNQVNVKADAYDR